MHLQVKCHNQSCQLHLAILKLKLTFPLIPFQNNIDLTNEQNHIIQIYNKDQNIYLPNSNIFKASE